MTTYSTVIKRFVDQAEALGLVVEVHDNNSDHILQSVSVTITRKQVEAENMLDVVRNAERLALHCVRTFNEGRWKNSARFYSYSDYRGSKMTLRSVKYRLEQMAEVVR